MSSWRRGATVAMLSLLLFSGVLRVWYASVELNVTRYWDERYGLENVRGLLDGQLRPLNGFHPSLSYLPQAGALAAFEKLHEWTGYEWLQVRQVKRFTATGYLICRLIQVIFGLLSLWLLFLLGKELDSPEVGLLGALLLSATPWHIRQSGIYKPDILLVLMVLASVYVSLWALKRASLSKFLLAGGVIGLALASKFNAGPAAVPLATGALLGGRKDRRLLLWLGLAGVTAGLTFLAFNPYVVIELEIYLRSFGQTLRHYTRQGATRGGSHWGMPIHAVSSLTGGGYFGPLIGGLGLAGLIVITRNLSASSDRGKRLCWWLMLSYVLAYVVGYSLSTTNPSSHNWLPVAPFIALAAAWMVVHGLRWFTAGGGTGRTVLAGAALTLLVLSVLFQASRFVYLGVVPTTARIAASHIRNAIRDPRGRLVYSEVKLDRRALRMGSHHLPYVLLSDLEQISPHRLSLADAEVFREERLAGATRTFFQSRLSAHPKTRVETVSSKWFRSRGEPLVVVLHPPRPRRKMKGVGGVLTRIALEPLEYSLPTENFPPTGTLVSLEIAVRGRSRRGNVALELVTADERIEMFAFRFRPGGVRFQSPRFSLRAPVRIRVEGVRKNWVPDALYFQLVDWQPRQ